MLTWHNRSIDTLSVPELRRALYDALNEVAWSRAAPSSTSFFHALLLGFSAGALVAAAAMLTFSILA
jgi:predicted esterase